MFSFKQFSVSQQNCAMKINTDGVLLAAMADFEFKKSILDIGTGTGVIALMLAQLNVMAIIDAIDIDAEATKTAALNFKNSPFAHRLNAFNQGFEHYFINNPLKFYDLIISNPPFFIDALKSDNESKNLARHTNIGFFDSLFSQAKQHLTNEGCLQIIVPTQIENQIIQIALQNNLYLNCKTIITSFINSKPIRCILNFNKNKLVYQETTFAIYESQGIHSAGYKTALKDFFILF